MTSWVEHFFFSMMWIFIIIIVGIAILHFVSGFGGGIGNLADWFGRKTQY